MDNDYDIAIVGMSCRLPGAQNLDEFWRNLAGGIESIERLSDQEILQSGVPSSYLSNPNYVKAAPILAEPGCFDAGFFGFSPMEAKTMDPQHRILLELAYEALESAGYDSDRYQGRIGVFTGSALNTYFTHLGLNRRLAENYIPTLLGNDKDFLSTRISYKLNLKGPSITVQTACSTSMVALHLARQSLLSGETDMALVGAISVRVPHHAGYFCDGGGIVSSDGHVRAFDANANGTVFGSGGGILVLKRLASALADDDIIHAVIRGSAVNNDGSEKAGYSAPSINGQADAVVEALANAGVDADSISYIEAHGSGTPVGDPIEIRALTKAFRTSTQRSGFCAIGSVKTNIGHLDAAAGIAGMIKTVLALKHRKLPPSLHFSAANPEIDFPRTPFYVNTHLREWVSDGPRRAGVMSTGMGGTNAYVVLEEAPEPAASTNPASPHLLTLSAKTEAALAQATQRLLDFLNRHASVNMSDVAYTLRIGRKAFAHRRCLVCLDREDAISALGQEGSKRVVSSQVSGSRRPVILLLPGIGDHYVGMAHELYETWPVFRQEVDRCAQILERQLAIDIRTIIYPSSHSWKQEGKSKGIDLKKMLGGRSNSPEDPDTRQLNSTLYAQPALFTIEYATARLWQALGITPDAIVGHSMGEYVAACLAGVLSLEDALRLIATRAKLVNELPQGAMLAVTLPESELLPLLPESLSVSLINGPRLCVAAGPVATVAELEKKLTARGVICRHVQNAHAFHSRMLDPIVTAFEREVKKVALNKPTVRYMSNVSGTWITDAEATNPAYWAMHANHTARFSDALHQLWQFKNPILLEAGPGRTLGVLATQHPDRDPATETTAISSIRHHYEHTSDSDFILQAIGRLWLAGVSIDWENLDRGENRRRVSLPTYPFERHNYWLPATSDAPSASQEQAPSATAGLDDWFYVPTWERTPFCHRPPEAGASWLVFTDRWGGGTAFRRELEKSSAVVHVARFGEAFRRRSDGSIEINPTSLDDYLKLFRELHGQLGDSLNVIHLGCLAADHAPPDRATRERNQDFGFFSLVYIAQAICELDISIPIRIGIISNRMHEVTGDEALDPQMATVLGPSGVIPRELPNVQCFSVDLPDARVHEELSGEVITKILPEFAQASPNGVIAYRGKHRWRRKYERVNLPVPTDSTRPGAVLRPRRLRDGGVYLITGGTGGLGLAFAKYLARTCKARLVLTKKAAFPEKSTWKALSRSKNAPEPVLRTIDELLEIERLGATVEVYVAEASDQDRMRAVIDETLERFQTIDGVIHAAGIVKPGLIKTLTKETADSVLSPKVQGTMVLSDLLSGVDLDFLVLFSSMSSVTRPYAHADYSAANSFLDAFASHSNSQAKFHTLAINWPVWKEVGIGAGTSYFADLQALLGVEHLQEEALERAMLTNDGLEAFARALDSDLPQVIVSPENLDGLIERSERALAPLQGARKFDGAIPATGGQSGQVDQPSNEVEAAVAQIWMDVFGHQQIGVHQQFSTLGGHSLIAMQIVSKIRSAYRIALSLRDFFEAPTVAQLSAVVQARTVTAVGSVVDEEPIRALARADRRALSSSERRLWFFDQFEPGSSAYNAGFELALDGEVRIDMLERSLSAVVIRHDALRTRYLAEDGEPFAVVDPPGPRALPLVDMLGADREQEAARLVELDAERPFDLAAGPLWRALLVRISEKRFLLGVTLHHIVADGWSVGIFTRELMATYVALTKGAASGLPDLPFQYADFATWESGWIRSGTAARQLEYWRERASGVSVMDVPADFPRPRVQTFRGGSCGGQLSAELNRSLGEFSRAHGATPFMTLLAAFGLLLHRLSGIDDVALGVPVAGRERKGTDQLIGMFVNTILFRQDHSRDLSFVDLLRNTRTQALAGYSNAEVPFDHVVNAVQVSRSTGRTPLFQVLVNTLDFSVGGRFSLPGIQVELKVTQVAASKFDMTLYLGLEEDTTRLMLTYNADLFTSARMQELLVQFQGLLGHVLRDPERRVSEISLLTPSAAAVLPDPTCPFRDGVSESLPAGLARRMAHANARVAVTGQDEAWTREDVEVRANRLADRLLRNGLHQQDVVAIYASREPMMVCAMLGVLKAGAAFAILDPTYPAARLVASWRAAGPRSAILLDGAGELPPALQAEIAALAPELRIRLSNATLEVGPTSSLFHGPALPIRPDDLAYVAFTSGTTGGVKAILGTHGPVVHFLDWQARTFALGPNDRFGMLSGLSHDPLLRDVLAPLWMGGSLHVPDPTSIGEPGWLADWIDREKLTVVHLTPAMAELVTTGADCRMDSLRWIFVGGDVLTAATVDRLRSAAPNATCVNLYGATETPQAMGYYVVPRSGETRARVPLGRGIEDVQLLVLNASNTVAGVGELGEIVIRTPYLALGYRGDDQLTRERFTTNPCSSDPKDRVYRTGDLGRYLPDGSVEFCGRRDGQAKLRGFRLELGEIEAALREHPSVSDAVAAVREESEDERRLVGYVVPAAGPIPTWAALRAFLRERLPEYAVPGTFAVIDSIPLTPNGKIDRRGLPAPKQESLQASEWEPPLTSTEEIVAGIFAEVLGLARVGRHSNFFELGGHSLVGTRAVSRVRAALRVDIPLRALFEAPTPAQLAAHVDTQLRCPGEVVPPPSRVQRDGKLPLSFSQQRLWFLHQIEPQSAAYNVAAAVRLSGVLDRDALRGALAAIIARHESLRTIIRNDTGSPVQVVADDPAEALSLHDASAEALTEVELGAAMHTEITRPFDLERGPLLRALLYRRAEREYVLLLSAHHIVLDAWSMGIFVRELGEFYEQLGSGNEAVLPPLPLQYVDFACWQRTCLEGPELERLLEYWRADLSGAPSVLDLPTDRPRPPVETHRGARHQFLLPSELQRELLNLSRREGATLFMTLLAALALLLSRYSGQKDIVVGTPVANRSRPELEGLIGFFVNTLLMRTRIPDDGTFRQLLSSVRETCLGAYAHQDLPFEKLVEELRPERDTSRNPLFQVMLVLQNVPLPALTLKDLEVTPWPLDRHASQVDLTLYLQETELGLRGTFEYATDLFDAATIERMAGQMQRLLEGIVESAEAQLCELPLLSDGERGRLLLEWNDTAADYPAQALVQELFEAQVERAPERTAVRTGTTVLSYAELDTHANRLAQALRSRGVGRGQRVGLCVERGADMLAAVLGILKAGAAYVPLDPSFPAERLRFMAQDAQLSLLVSTSVLAQSFELPRERQLLLDADAASIASAPDTRLPADAHSARPEDPAYVIYTSGSTGKPKGVVVPHRAVVNFLTSMAREPGLEADDVLVAVTTLSFDIAVLELQLPLTVGATVVIATRDEAIQAQALSSLLEQHRATVMQATPVTWRLLLEAGWTGRTPFKALVGGEALPKDLAEQLIARGVELWNLYGPTETTVWSTCARITDTCNAISIGKPIANTTIYILDAHRNLCPIGVPGELYIGGAGVTLGYWNRPELTAERFIADPFSATPGARLYRTGDRARWRSDGTLEHLGRLDDQAKVRGFRIELGEIEAVLAEHPEVRQAAVHLWKVKANDVRIVACCVPAKAGVLAPISLRKHMRARLPEYMVPQHFLLVEQIPLTPNGKIDRSKLPTPAVTEGNFQRHELPSDPVEATIAQIWTNLIGPARSIGRADKFFEMGGHSLLGLQALRQMEHKLGVKLDFRVLFQESLADIATRCRSEQIAQRPAQAPTTPHLQLHADSPLKDRVI